jgi:hypothetical protein
MTKPNYLSGLVRDTHWGSGMPGRYVSRVWTYDPTIDAPAKYRRACKYDAFIPVTLAELPLTWMRTWPGSSRRRRR